MKTKLIILIFAFNLIFIEFAYSVDTIERHILEIDSISSSNLNIEFKDLNEIKNLLKKDQKWHEKYSTIIAAIFPAILTVIVIMIQTKKIERNNNKQISSAKENLDKQLLENFKLEKYRKDNENYLKRKENIMKCITNFIEITNQILCKLTEITSIYNNNINSFNDEVTNYFSESDVRKNLLMSYYNVLLRLGMTDDENKIKQEIKVIIEQIYFNFNIEDLNSEKLNISINKIINLTQLIDIQHK